MAIWTTDDVNIITTYIDGLTINSIDDWKAAWPGDEDAAIQVADIDLNSAIEEFNVDINGAEVTVHIKYRNTETADDETGAISFTTEEINKTYTIAN